MGGGIGGTALLAEETLHGPFTHMINKGGLDNIVRQGAMLSTTGQYGDVCNLNHKMGLVEA